MQEKNRKNIYYWLFRIDCIIFKYSLGYAKSFFFLSLCLGGFSKRNYPCLDRVSSSIDIIDKDYIFIRKIDA
ncbi:MAG: hypothetical protein AB1502_09570 [Thermodesulfobacteriota bacterium]